MGKGVEGHSPARETGLIGYKIRRHESIYKLKVPDLTGQLIPGNYCITLDQMRFVFQSHVVAYPG